MNLRFFSPTRLLTKCGMAASTSRTLPKHFMCTNLNRRLTEEDVKITPRAVERLKQILEKNERLRVEVDGGGCSGFEYKIKLDSNIGEEDRLLMKDGVEVVVDKMSLGYMKGSTIDFVEDLMKASFRIVNNPAAEKGCSCGSSFALKMD